jgi:hypothetical protein
VPNLSYYGRFYETIRYDSKDSYRDYLGLSMQHMWNFISVEPNLGRPLPLLEVLLGLWTTFRDKKSLRSDPGKSEVLIEAETVRFDAHESYEIPEDVVYTGTFIVQRVISRNKPLFNAILGWKRNTKKAISTKNYFKFLRETVPRTYERYQELISGELDEAPVNLVQEDWLNGMLWVRRHLKESGIDFFLALFELKEKTKFILFEGFDVKAVVRFVAFEIGFENPVRPPPESFYVHGTVE